MSNIGGYDKFAFGESKGNAQIKIILEEKSSIKTHFNEADKIPNIDGYFELLENNCDKSVPIHRVEVQIKTMNGSYFNENKCKNKSQYKYQLDTKILEYAKRKVTLDPVVLFLLDINSKKYFWKHLSYGYITALNYADNDNQTIYFNDNNQITDIDAFYDNMKKICVENGKQSNTLENNKVSGDNIDPQLRKKLLNEWDYINSLFDNELRFIKDALFNDVWKFGIGFKETKNENDNDKKDSVKVNIYKINFNQQNKCFVQKIIEDEDNQDIFTYEIRGGDVNIYNVDVHKLVSEAVIIIVKHYFERYFIDLKYFHSMVLEDILFNFLDELTIIAKHMEKKGFPRVYYKDTESINEIENLLSSWLNTISPLSDLKVRRKAILFSKAFTEIKQRNIDSISRVWKHPDYLNFMDDLKDKSGFDRIETGYKLSDYDSNLSKLFNFLPEQYNHVAKQLYAKNFENLKNRYEYAFFYTIKNGFDYCMFKTLSNEFAIKTSDYKDFSYNEIDEIIKSNSIGSFVRGAELRIVDYNPLSYAYICELIKSDIQRYLNIDDNDNTRDFIF